MKSSLIVTLGIVALALFATAAGAQTTNFNVCVRATTPIQGCMAVMNCKVCSSRAVENY